LPEFVLIGALCLPNAINSILTPAGFELRCIGTMRYLVKAKVKPGQEKPLLAAIESGTLGRGSVAGGEYLDDMAKARIRADGVCSWVEVCFCATPLQEERPYWEQYFDLLRIKDAHARKNCRDASGTEPWACCDCDCTRKLEQRLETVGQPFLDKLKNGFGVKS
jgi:hypothetical protein